MEVFCVGNGGNVISVNRDRSIRFHRRCARADDRHMQKDEGSIASLRRASAVKQRTEKKQTAQVGGPTDFHPPNLLRKGLQNDWGVTRGAPGLAFETWDPPSQGSSRNPRCTSSGRATANLVHGWPVAASLQTGRRWKKAR